MHKGAFILAVIGITLIALGVIITISPAARASLDSITGSSAIVDVSPSSGPTPLVAIVTCYAGSNSIYPPDYFTLAFGDGTTSTIGPVSSGVVSLAHVYNSAGIYSVVCTVLDQNNDMSKGTASVSVLLGGTTATTQTSLTTQTSASTTTVTTTYTISQGSVTTVSGSATTIAGTTFVTTQTVTQTVTSTSTNPVLANLNLVFASLGIVFLVAGGIVAKYA